MQTRRNFLSTLGVATLGVATLGVATLGVADRKALAANGLVAPRRQLERIGLQLYTVRDLMKADFLGTLAKVAAIGYKEVELTDYFGRTPRQIRELLLRNRLVAPSTHLPFESLQKGWRQALDDSNTIGVHWVTIAWIPEEERRTIDDWSRLADLFNRAAAQAKSAGLRFAYHNHDVELRKIGGERPLDILLQKTDPSLIDFEMDLYWAVLGGGDPLDFFNRYPKRFTMLHVKDSSGPPDNRMVDVGKGTIDFRSIFAQSDRAGIKHYFVEHDNPADPIATIRNSYDYLRALRF